jgi:thiamine pyrophosphate-dependent acetolactate synthase large subunit-like protein
MFSRRKFAEKFHSDATKLKTNVRRDASGSVWYYATKVVCVEGDGSVRVNSGGYHTASTRALVNEVLKLMDIDAYWYQRNGQQRLMIGNGKHEEVYCA